MIQLAATELRDQPYIADSNQGLERVPPALRKSPPRSRWTKLPALLSGGGPS